MPDSSAGADLVRRLACPSWCVTRHGVHAGEEDWVHHGEPLVLDDVTSAQLCMSIDPSTGVADGPYVLIGSREYGLAEVEALGIRLAALAAGGRSGPPTVAVI